MEHRLYLNVSNPNRYMTKRVRRPFCVCVRCERVYWVGEIKCSAGAGEKLYTHAQQHIQQSMRGRFDYTCVEMAFCDKKKVKGKEGGKSNFLARLNEFFRWDEVTCEGWLWKMSSLKFDKKIIFCFEGKYVEGWK